MGSPLKILLLVSWCFISNISESLNCAGLDKQLKQRGRPLVVTNSMHNYGINMTGDWHGGPFNNFKFHFLVEQV
jgi:hypothetical protein